MIASEAAYMYPKVTVFGTEQLCMWFRSVGSYLLIRCNRHWLHRLITAYRQPSSIHCRIKWLVAPQDIGVLRCILRT
ncbi:hypothetical protein Q31a_24210 [Aureliella helgolandensis]|uniref:Uncharacterized protein n=1 Tax=Aureliella helgolandensis TaxID=2527968 RepID=A0A518G689_9BACT|nr:hypothetical protein Q31a_24210 [Aureliella helgolandensis]